jgi:hypothetical protein
MPVTRRALLLAGAALPLAAPALAQPERTLHVRKDPSCECCTAWVEHLRQAGFDVTVEEVHAGLLVTYKAERGVPLELQSCHTGEAGGYVVEGHVPAADIDRLLAERPEALGLAVPGMPYGSPGMGDEAERDAYEVILFRADGTSEVWASYAAA